MIQQNAVEIRRTIDLRKMAGSVDFRIGGVDERNLSH
jgi:hypothetical protein